MQGNETISAVVHQICDWEISTGNEVLYAVLQLIGIIILFTAIAIVCDDYFVPSLDVICKRLNLSEDVAGATFMAAGSSAPELFTSRVAVTKESSVGVGTIVGSAVFNILIIISLSAVLCKNVLVLDWRPLTRDTLFYGCSICIFVGFAWDGQFTWWESLITFLYYFVYILSMKFNKKLFQLLDIINRIFCKCTTEPADSEVESNKVHVMCEPVTKPCSVQITPPSVSENHQSEGKEELPVGNLGVPLTMNRTHSSGSSGIGSMTDDTNFATEADPKWTLEKSDSLESVCMEDKEKQVANGTNGDAKPVESDTSSECSDFDEVTVCCCDIFPKVMTSIPALQKPEESSCLSSTLSYLKLAINIFYFCIAFPFQLLFSFTIPNCMRPHLRKYYIVSFVGSVAWIAILSYGMVTLVERFGCILGIDEYVMGLVVVAAGTSVPDALSSVIVAREGHGDMAVSNALGSNVFDINLGLGLPFLIRVLYSGESVKLLSQEKMDLLNGGITPHAKFGIILLGILMTVISIISFCKFKLNKISGLIFILIYIAFIAYAVIQEVHCDGFTC